MRLPKLRLSRGPRPPRKAGDAAAWDLRTDPRVRLFGAAVILILVVGLVPIALSGAPIVPTATPTASPTEGVSVVVTTSAPTLPPPTPEGTPAPKPPEPIDTGASATVTPPTPAPQATATATPQPGLWRVQGYVVDENGNPLENVCVVVGPRGCQRASPRTDTRGHYHLDVAATTPNAPATFDFFFEMPGRQTVWWRFVPSGPIEFNVVLKRA